MYLELGGGFEGDSVARAGGLSDVVAGSHRPKIHIGVGEATRPHFHAYEASHGRDRRLFRVVSHALPLFDTHRDRLRRC